MAGGRTVGVMNLSLVVRTKQFLSGMKKARRVVKKFADGFPVLNRRVGAFFAALGASAAIGVTVMINKQRQAIDILGKFSDELRIPTEDLATFGLAAKLTGTNITVLRRGIQRLQIRLGEAAKGIGEGVKGFKALGLNAKELSKLDLGEVIKIIAERVQKLGAGTKVASAGFAIMSRQFSDLTNFFLLGRNGLDSVRESAEKLGLIVSRVATKEVENMNDAMVLAETAASGVVRQLTVLLSPALEAAANAFTDFVTSGGGAFEKAENFITFGIKAISVVNSIFLSLRGTFKLIQFVVAAVFESFVKTLRVVAELALLIPRLFGSETAQKATDFFRDLDKASQKSKVRFFQSAAQDFSDAAFGGELFEKNLTNRLKKIGTIARLNAISQLKGKDVQKALLETPTLLGSLSILQKSRIADLKAEPAPSELEEKIRDKSLVDMKDTLKQIRDAINETNKRVRDEKNNKNATLTFSKDGR